MRGGFIVDRSQRHLKVSRINPAIERRRERGGEWTKGLREEWRTRRAHGRFV